VHFSGDTLIALDSRMSLAVQFSLLAPLTGAPNTFCMQDVLATVGPLSAASAGMAESISPAAVAAIDATTRPVVSLHVLMKFSRK